MSSFHDLTTSQLKQALQLREQIESLQTKLDAILGGTSPVSSSLTKGRRVVSAATKKRMAAAQQARYAKLKAPTGPTKITTTQGAPKKPGSKKKVMSPEAKAKIAAAMKARWAAKKNG